MNKATSPPSPMCWMIPTTSPSSTMWPQKKIIFEHTQEAEEECRISITAEYSILSCTDLQYSTAMRPTPTRRWMRISAGELRREMTHTNQVTVVFNIIHAAWCSSKMSSSAIAAEADRTSDSRKSGALAPLFLLLLSSVILLLILLFLLLILLFYHDEKNLFYKMNPNTSVICQCVTLHCLASTLLKFRQ